MTRNRKDDPRVRIAEFERALNKRAEQGATPHVDWTECAPDQRASAADMATTLKPFGYDDIVLRPAFERFCLDHHHPFSWRKLIDIFVTSHWPYPKDWTPERLHALLAQSESLIGLYPELAKAGKDTKLLKMIAELREGSGLVNRFRLRQNGARPVMINKKTSAEVPPRIERFLPKIRCSFYSLISFGTQENFAQEVFICMASGKGGQQ